eukprot:m.30649 g.30649  ORF g.30649 m.30649 type:complete len:326 (+) comp10630_c0_seq1:412-1389(+)
MKFETIAAVHQDVPCFTAALRRDEKEIAIGRKDGAIAIYKHEGDSLRQVNTLHPPASAINMPVMSIRYLPPSKDSALGNMVVAADASGVIRAWHTSSGQLLHTIHVGEDAAFTCMDINSSSIVASGYDHLLHMFDLATFKPIRTLGFASSEVGAFSQQSIISHSNRVFSCLFHPIDENIIVSAGWDRTVLIWDTRQAHAIGHISGPYLAGDGLSFDASGEKLFTASYEPKIGLECWDFGERRRTWRSSGEHDIHLYSCQSTSKGFVMACGSQPSQVHLVDELTGNVVGRQSYDHALFDIKQLHDGQQFIATGDQTLTLVSLNADK